nr:SHOCT domain-containing protein [Paenibacillus barengoltzii]
MKWIAKGEPEQFVKEVRKRIGKKDMTGSSNDVYDQIEKLAVLKDKKLITASEYEDKKAQLLKRI